MKYSNVILRRKFIDRIIIAFFVAVMLFGGMAGCGESVPASSITTTKDEEGHSIQQTESYTTVFYDDLPCKVKYNDGEFALTDLQFYEDQRDDYSFGLFAVATIDLSLLTDEQIHWLREEDLRVSVYFTQEKNDFDFQPLSTLGSLFLTDMKTMKVVFINPVLHSCRYSFSGAEVSCVVDAKQEGTYNYTSKETGDTSKLHKEYSIHYQLVVPENLSSASTIDSFLASYISKWFDTDIEFWTGLMNSSKK